MASPEPMTVMIGLTADTAQVVDVFDGLFALLDEQESLIPEWNEMERAALVAKRNELAKRASGLIGTLNGSP